MTPNTLILNLYRGTREIAPLTFQDWALDQLKTLAQFNSAIWGRGGVENGMAQIYSVHLHHLPPDSLASYARFRERDTVGAAAMRAMGSTINTVARTALAADPEMYEHHVQRYGLEYSLNTCIADPRTGLISFITLFRPESSAPFSEDERCTVEGVMPHLIESCQQSRLFQLSVGDAASGAARHLAACDSDFVLIAIRDAFAELLRKEWPEWMPPRLPESVRASLQQSTHSRHSGERIVITGERVSDLYWLSARELAPIDALSPRQLQIAELTAEGKTHKEIAETLKLAPATVRNHIDAIYRKLGIGSRGELATQLAKRA